MKAEYSIIIRTLGQWGGAAVLSSVILTASCAPSRIVVRTDETLRNSSFHPSAPNPAANHVPVRPAKDRHLLILTTGGADGAFGAGVLNAWSASGSRPVFDIVAGSSTGALQATYAFLGSERDGQLREMYTTTTTRDLFSSNGPAALLRSGLYNPAPLRRKLMELLDDDLLDEVAAAHQAGRRLYVTTTDLTRGEAVFWDMGAIATHSRERRHHFVDILIASAAAPGLIQPVEFLDESEGIRALHADGGIKTPVPLESFMLPRSSARATTVWVVANGHVSRKTSLKSEAEKTLPLARRGVTQLIRQLLYTSARQAESKALSAGSAFHLISIPEDIPETNNPFDFKPEEMSSLYRSGWDVGSAAFGASRPGREPTQ